MNIDTTSATAGGEVAPMVTPTPNIGATTTVVRLPNGTVLAVIPTGIESRLAAFIADSTRMADKTTWFEFDRLKFANNSANLLPESQDQLANVAKVLAAYPNVAVKIGGYTDNVGKPAANKKLSAERAANVRLALIKDGVAPGRLTSEGYGDDASGRGQLHRRGTRAESPHRDIGRQEVAQHRRSRKRGAPEQGAPLCRVPAYTSAI